MENPAPLDRARRKAYWRLLPLLFICYVIAYVDRANVAIAKLTMTKDLPGFDNAVIGFGAGVFFWGYFLLEVPGSLIVEKYSARKWICRIMITWGIMAAMTGFVHCHIPGFTPCAEALRGILLSGEDSTLLYCVTHRAPITRKPAPRNANSGPRRCRSETARV